MGEQRTQRTQEEPYRVEVKQGESVVGFEFSRMSYAIEFATTCFECADNNTEITMIKEEE